MKRYLLLSPVVIIFVLGPVWWTGCGSMSQDKDRYTAVLLTEMAQQHPELLPKLNELASGPEGEKLKLVATYFADLLSEGKLPGIASGDHGHFTIYPLLPIVQKDWLHSGIFDKNMLLDIRGSLGFPYIVSTVIGESTVGAERTYVYHFFSVNDAGAVRLISAYHYVGGRWGKMKAT